MQDTPTAVLGVQQERCLSQTNYEHLFSKRSGLVLYINLSSATAVVVGTDTLLVGVINQLSCQNLQCGCVISCHRPYTAVGKL